MTVMANLHETSLSPRSRERDVPASANSLESQNSLGEDVDLIATYVCGGSSTSTFHELAGGECSRTPRGARRVRSEGDYVKSKMHFSRIRTVLTAGARSA